MWCKADKTSCDRQGDDTAERSQAPFSCCPFTCEIPFPSQGSFPEKSLIKCYRRAQCHMERRKSYKIQVQIIGQCKLTGLYSKHFGFGCLFSWYL